jgi:riboflavin biosynthesis pyrimidine reductase
VRQGRERSRQPEPWQHAVVETGHGADLIAGKGQDVKAGPVVDAVRGAQVGPERRLTVRSRPDEVKPAARAEQLKQELSGDLVIPASFQLIRTLLEHDQVDELRLNIFPVVLGAGERLFGETSGTKPMRLLAAQALEAGITYLTYQPVRDAQ